MLKVLVTGGSGFVGTAFIAHLSKEPLELHSLGRSRVDDVTHWKLSNLTDLSYITDVVSRIRPNIVLHLAGNPYTSSALESEMVNFQFAVNILEAVERAGLKGLTRLLFFGSAAEYGAPAKPGDPIEEDQSCNPQSNYGKNKLRQTEHVRRCFEAGHRAIIVRPFTIVGSNMPKNMAIPQFIEEAHQIALSNEVSNSIKLQNPQTYRDFIGVRDVVAIAWKLANLDIALGETFNICSGRAVSLRSVVNYISEELNIKKPTSLSGGGESGPIDMHFGSNAKLISVVGELQIDDWKTMINRML